MYNIRLPVATREAIAHRAGGHNDCHVSENGVEKYVNIFEIYFITKSPVHLSLNSDIITYIEI